MNAVTPVQSIKYENKTSGGVPLHDLVGRVKGHVASIAARDGRKSRLESLEAMWRFYRLGQADRWVQLVALGCDGDKFVWIDDQKVRHKTTAAQYVRTAREAEEALIDGGDGPESSPLSIDKWLSNQAHCTPTGYYFSPVVFDAASIDPGLSRLSWTTAKGGQLLQDKSIKAVTGLSIDVDRKRDKPNASEQEHLEAIGVALAISDLFVELGVPLSALAQGSSGNGGRCDLAVDLPNDRSFGPWVTRFINAVARVFDVYDGDQQLIDVDTKCSNPARLLPLYGSVKAKAEHSDEHPHRRTYFVFPHEAVTPLDSGAFRRLVESLEARAQLFPDRTEAKVLGEVGAPPADLDSIPMSDRVSRAAKYVSRIDTVAVQGHGGNATTWAVVLGVTRGFALGEEEAFGVLDSWNQRCEPPWEESALRAKIRDAIEKSKTPLGFKLGRRKRPKGDWHKDLLMTFVGRGESKKLVVRNVRENVEICLRGDPNLEGLVRFDEFRNDIVFAKPVPWAAEYVGSAKDSPIGSSWKDVDDLRFAGYLSRTRGMVGLDPQTIVQALLVVAHDDRVHPIREYLSGLKWDGVRRVDTWLPTYAGALTKYGFEDEPAKGAEYVSLVGKWWLLQAVARVFKPGVKCDSTLVLEGNQGVLKSSLLSILAGEAYFSDGDLGDLKSKESAMQLQGVWIQELGEGEIFSRASRRALKAFLTKKRDDYIPKHSNRKTKVPRHTVFCVTTNDREYLDDSTGERRWWPVYVEKIDFEKLTRDRDQLWAEATHLYEKGEVWWARTDAEKALCEAATGERKLSHPWADQIRLRLKNDVPEGQTISVNEVLTNVLGLSLASLKNSFEAQKVREILREQGWEPEKRNKHGQRWARGPSALPYEGPSGDPVDQLGDGELDEFFESSKSVAEIERLREQNQKLTARLDRVQEGAGKTYDRYVLALRELQSLGVPLPIDEHELDALN